ncbi:MAG: hypothetical protein ACLVKK_00340 [Ruthenibacterium sp.]
MKGQATLIRKLALGAVCILLAAGFTLLLKEVLDTQEPEQALPILEVRCNDVPMPPEYLLRAGYEWNFFTTKETKAPVIPNEEMGLMPMEVMAQTPVVVSYSTRPKELKLQRWDAATGEYVEVTTTTPGHFQAPTVAGRYVYRVTGTWAFRGEIQDYFCLQVT